MPVTDLPWAVEDVKRRAPAYARRRAYADGHHDRVIPDGKALNPTLRAIVDELTDNLCADVVDEPVGRLQITNWSGKAADLVDEPTVPGQPAAPVRDLLGQAAMDSWTRNRGTARAREVHRSTIGLADGFVIVQKDETGVARWYPQRPEQMAVRYSTDDPDRIDVAAKVWKVGKAWRLNLYYADGTVERYITRGSSPDGGLPQARAFQAVTDADGQGLPVEQTDDRRMPVHHLPHDELGRYGRSVLSDVIPLQNVLNKSVVDLVVAMEKHALPDRWATGIQVEYGPDGVERNPFTAGRTWRTGNAAARFGEFAAAEMAPFLAVQENYRLRIAHKGYLPLHSVRIEGDASAPSGVALLVAEGRTVKHVKRIQHDAGLFWREVQAHVLSLEMGRPVDPEDLDLDWAPAETRDEVALVETLGQKVALLGLPKREALVEAGYDPADVDRWMEDGQAAAQAIAGGRTSPAGALPPGAPPQAFLALPQAPGAPPLGSA